MLNKFTVKIIEGTREIVVNEILKLDPEIKFLRSGKKVIIFETKFDLQHFKKLYSALEIFDHQLRQKVKFNQRSWRQSYSNSGLQPSLAWIMCKLSGINEKSLLLDPFCGSGIIPIIAAIEFNAAKIFATDVSGRAIDSTQINIAEAKLNRDQYFTSRLNVSQLRFPKNYFDAIVSNLPFGIRSGRFDQNEKIYNIFGRKARSFLKSEGKIVLLTNQDELIRRYFLTNGFTLQPIIPIIQGGIKATIYVMNRTFWEY